MRQKEEITKALEIVNNMIDLLTLKTTGFQETGIKQYQIASMILQWILEPTKIKDFDAVLKHSKEFIIENTSKTQ